MINLIAGRTGRGKDWFAKILENNGFKLLKSYSTRKPRFEGEDTHIFITNEEADAIPATEKVATTEINGVKYFATKQQLEECNVYIIDPKGIYELAKNCPDEDFHLLYITADDDEARQHAIDRATDSDNEVAIFDSRFAAEDEQFTAFEKQLELYDARKENDIPKNINVVHLIKNDFDDEFAKCALGIVKFDKARTNMLEIVNWCIENNQLIKTDDEGKILVTFVGDKEKTDVYVSKDVFIDLMTVNDSLMFKQFMQNFIIVCTDLNKINHSDTCKHTSE